MADQFVKVAEIDAIPPGKMLCVALPTGRVLLANVDGRILAADDMCTHEDASLTTGSLKGHYVKCPLHGSRFDLFTGEAMDEPAEQALRIYAVKIDGVDVLVKID